MSSKRGTATAAVRVAVATHTRVDSILITPEIMQSWENPPFQRPCKVNEKVRSLAETIKVNGGVLPGVITIGILGKTNYLIDGQHRREAFLISGCDEGYTDIRYQDFESMSDMGEAFVNLNSQLVRLRPDDILRGLEGSLETLKLIRKRCAFVGYDMIRRGTSSPLVSMATSIRSWSAAAMETPNTGGAGSAAQMAKDLTTADAQHLAGFLTLAERAFGRDNEYARLWGGLNMTLCMWIFRRTVLGQGHEFAGKVDALTGEQFTKCLMSLSADSHYIEWLVGRKLSDRDRAPAYSRITTPFKKRIAADTGVRPGKINLPQPEWAAQMRSSQ